MDKTMQNVLFIFVGFLSCCYGAKEIVQFGACYQPKTNGYRCSFSSAYCFESDGEEWLTPFQVRTEGPDREECLCQDTQMGSCMLPAYKGRACRFEQSACPYADTPSGRTGFTQKLYYSNSGRLCHCHGQVGHQHSTAEVEYEESLYGACQTNGKFDMCVLSSANCDSPATWVDPESLRDSYGKECTCKNTYVGACYSPIHSFCAVDSDSCDDGYTFINPQQTIDKLDLECMLCDKKEMRDQSVQTSPSRSSFVGVSVALSFSLLASLIMAFMLFRKSSGFGACCSLFKRKQDSSEQSTTP